MTPAHLIDPFHRARLAIVDGRVAELRGLLAEYPELATARTAAPHAATLLHYVAANGLEDEWQRCSPQASDVARALLEAGADVDATCGFWGGGPQATTLIALVTSVHPARLGVQGAVVRVLAEYGAALEGLAADGSPLGCALAFGYLEPARVLQELGARIRNLPMAAGLGELQAVESFLGRPAEPYGGVGLRVGEGRQGALDWAFVYACMHRHVAIAELLLDEGADPGARGHQGMTALHHALWYGHTEVFEMLLAHRAPLEIPNDYGGTPLDFLAWVAGHGPLPGVDYPYFARRLLDAGASAGAVTPFPTGLADLDEVLRDRR